MTKFCDIFHDIQFFLDVPVCALLVLGIFFSDFPDIFPGNFSVLHEAVQQAARGGGSSSAAREEGAVGEGHSDGGLHQTRTESHKTQQPDRSQHTNSAEYASVDSALDQKWLQTLLPVAVGMR